MSCLPWCSWVTCFLSLWTLCSIYSFAFAFKFPHSSLVNVNGLVFGSNYEVISFPLHSWENMLKPSNYMLQWWMYPKRIQVRPRQRLLRWNWRERLPWVPFSLCTDICFHLCPFGILINLLDLLMDRNAYNMPLVIEISWQILVWIRGDTPIPDYF